MRSQKLAFSASLRTAGIATIPVPRDDFPRNLLRRGACFGSRMHNDEQLDELTSQIIACAIRVHDVLGPGLLESVYRDCLTMELVAAGLKVEAEVRVPIEYRGRRVRDDLRLDLLVDGCVVVEVKSADRVHPVHLAQVMTYLKLANKPAGLLLNFNVTSLHAGLRRLDHPEIYAAKRAKNGVRPL